MRSDGLRDRLADFTRLLAARRQLPGDVAEFGVWDGHSTRQLAGLGRRVWAFDTFRGFAPEDHDSVLDIETQPGGFSATADAGGLSHLPNVVVVPGRFAETLPTIPRDVRFVLAYLDCDLYASYRQVLDWLFATDRLVPGAAVLCDDWYDTTGARRAITEFCAAHGMRFDPGCGLLAWERGIVPGKEEKNMGEQRPPRNREQQIAEQGCVDAVELAAYDEAGRAASPPADPAPVPRNPKSKEEVK